MISSETKRFCMGLVAWAAGVGFALSVNHWPISLGYGVCGPWGCGPETKVLIACHAGWLAALMPPFLLIFRRFPAWRTVMSRIAVGGGLLAIGAVMIYVKWIWLPSAGEFYQPYWIQRIGFILATDVRFPILQVVIMGGTAPLLYK